MQLLANEPRLIDDPDAIRRVSITIYEPAFGIIGDPAKCDPKTRQSADHSMVYIVATLLRKAYELRRNGWDGKNGWQQLMLVPADYVEDESALFEPLTRQLMERIDLRHGGPEYDAKYPDGIPTTLDIEQSELGTHTSGQIMYPEGHARSTSGNLEQLLGHKFRTLAALGVDDVDALERRFTNLADKSNEDVGSLYDFTIRGLERP